MARMDLRTMKFGKVYPLYVQKVERKGRSRAELDEVIGWLTGFKAAGIANQIARETDFATFFAQAPRMNPAASQIKGLICGIRVEEIDDPLIQQVRWLDKLVDELARGKAMDKIKRA